jgi:hypothetical protein
MNSDYANLHFLRTGRVPGSPSLATEAAAY